MADANAFSMDEHLKELLENTSSGRMKLLAAWDGLSIESQIKLLHALANGKRLYLSFHRDIIVKALQSPNEYIRYLAARSEGLHKDTETVNQVEADESPLVRFAQEEVKRHGRIDAPEFSPAEFLSSPKERQLAIARAENPPWPSQFAEILLHSINIRGVIDDDLKDVVFEYTQNPEVKKGRYGPEDLWEIVPSMPKSVAWKLAFYLPGEVADRVVIPETVQNWLHGDLLILFLCREDIGLGQFRKRIFFSNDDRYTDAHRMAAASRDFELSFDELHTLLTSQSPRLRLLATFESLTDIAVLLRCPLALDHLRLVFLECLKDYFERGIEHSRRSQDVDENAQCNIEEAFDQRIDRIKDKLLDRLSHTERRELRELKIYRLAKSVMPWAGTRDAEELCEPLKFLADTIVDGDTWATFMAFHKSLSTSYSLQSHSYVWDQYLPSLQELESQENEPHEKPARPDTFRGSNSTTAPVSDWLNWTASILRRLFR